MSPIREPELQVFYSFYCNLYKVRAKCPDHGSRAVSVSNYSISCIKGNLILTERRLITDGPTTAEQVIIASLNQNGSPRPLTHQISREIFQVPFWEGSELQNETKEKNNLRQENLLIRYFVINTTLVNSHLAKRVTASLELYPVRNQTMSYQ